MGHLGSAPFNYALIKLHFNCLAISRVRWPSFKTSQLKCLRSFEPQIVWFWRLKWFFLPHPINSEVSSFRFCIQDKKIKIVLYDVSSVSIVPRIAHKAFQKKMDTMSLGWKARAERVKMLWALSQWTLRNLIEIKVLFSLWREELQASAGEK